MIHSRNFFTLAACLVFVFSAAMPVFGSPEIPGAQQAGPIAIIGATLHPVSGPAIQGGVLLFVDGKIKAVGKNVELPRGVHKIDASGKHVYPGLFESSSNLGLVEIGAVRATRDARETGRFNPSSLAHVAVNPDSELIPVARSNGVLLALTAPGGGLISGQSAVLQLDGWTYEDLTLKPRIGMHVQWPRMTPASEWWIEESTAEQTKKRDRDLEELEEIFATARAYQKSRTAEGDGVEQATDIRYEAMLPVLEGKQPLIVDADEVQQIQSAVAFAQRHKVKLIILGGYDAQRCATLLKKTGTPVIIGGVHRLPLRRADHYDASFTLPERLRQAGVTYCISGSERMGASNVRNLAYHAATAAAYGLPPEEALKAITLYPAQILGVADRVGTLEQGKDATLFIADGDPLETVTQIENAFIQGREVNLSDRHKRLWKKYQEKYRRQVEDGGE